MYHAKFLSTVLSPATSVDPRRWSTCHAGLAALTRSIWVALCQPTPAGRTASTRISPRRSWGPEWAEHERVRAAALHTDVLELTASVPASVFIELAAHLLGRRDPYPGRGEWLGRTGDRSHPTSTGLGLWGQFSPAWSSQRQCGQRGTTLARPMNASL